MLGDDRVGRRLLPTQSVSGHGVWDRLQLGSVALELRRVRRRNKFCCRFLFRCSRRNPTLLARNVDQGGGGAKLAASGGRKPSPHESYEFKHPYLTIQLQCMNEPLLALLSPQQSNCGCHRTGSTACSCSDACCVRRIGSEATLLKATSLIASGR